MTATVFQRVGPYEIVEEIGRGGMAAVFLAEDSRHDRKVALKLVPLGNDREHREILEAERSGARLQAQLAETCGLVPRVYEDGEVPRYFFIAMEYVEGENLSDLIARGPVAPADATRISIDLCRFLDVAHQFETTIDGRQFRSLVHGDLKPRNVRVSTSGEIKVLDFGIAKALSLSRKVTRNDFGSMPYLSPERLDSVEVDAHADLWALGVIVYEMLSGGPPFHAADTRRLEQQIRAGYVARPLSPPCPISLQAIVARLLAPQLADRYSSASSVLDDLGRFQTGQPTEAEVKGLPPRIDDDATRRTRPAMDEETRRTRPEPNVPNVPTPVAASAPASAAAAAAKPAVPARPKKRRLRKVLLVLALLVLFNEMRVSFAAGRMAGNATTTDLDRLSEMWNDYQALSEGSYLRVGIIGLERVLRERSQELADQVIAAYRSAMPTVRERQWNTARSNLQQALATSPFDRRLKAALRYCEGHLHRIAGEAARRRREDSAANHFTEAVIAFREAAELRPEWPDPFLGLARTFIYGIDDLDRAAEALNEAKRLGFTSGERESAQLADGYSARAATLAQTARELVDLPLESEYLRRAVAAHREALALYERISSYPGAARNIRRVRRAIEQIEARLAELDILQGLETSARWE
jgi:serine/threonine protein kinase